MLSFLTYTHYQLPEERVWMNAILWLHVVFPKEVGELSSGDSWVRFQIKQSDQKSSIGIDGWYIQRKHPLAMCVSARSLNDQAIGGVQLHTNGK